MAPIHRIMQRCCGSKTYWHEAYEGTRSQCQTFIRNAAKHGRHTCSMYITSRTSDDFKRLNPL